MIKRAVRRRFADWATDQSLLNLNCYSFAVDCREPTPVSGAVPGRQTIGRRDRDWPYAPHFVSHLIKGAIADGLEQVKRIEWPPPGPYHYAALLMEDAQPQSFHWIRLDADGVWSHKWPGCAPECCLQGHRPPLTLTLDPHLGPFMRRAVFRVRKGITVY